MPTTIVMVRHGETEWNRENRFQGHADPPLNEAGRVQAQQLAEELAGETFEAAYASPLERAHETARILAARLDLDVRPSDALCEVDVGSRRIAVAHPDGQVLTVTHGGPIRSALAAAAGVAFGEARRSIHIVGNCAVVRLAIRDGMLERVD